MLRPRLVSVCVVCPALRCVASRELLSDDLIWLHRMMPPSSKIQVRRRITVALDLKIHIRSMMKSKSYS